MDAENFARKLENEAVELLSRPRPSNVKRPAALREAAAKARQWTRTTVTPSPDSLWGNNTILDAG